VTRLLVKVGGAVAGSSAGIVLELAGRGDEVCVVHGAGPQISEEMKRFGLEVEFVRGRRVTSPAALMLVRRSLAEVNTALCKAIGPRALGLLGDEIGLQAEPVPELGLVGVPLPSRPRAVEAALAAGRIPVVAPLAAGPLNVGMGAERILFVTDVRGVLLHGSVVDAIAAGEADRLLDAGELDGGIVPKLRAAVTAARLGVRAEIGETAVTT
jgi:acetylglutamate kinase